MNGREFFIYRSLRHGIIIRQYIVPEPVEGKMAVKLIRITI